MFSDLQNYISLLFYWWWPKAEGEITAVRILSGNGKLPLEYRFSLGDGYYTGETGCPSRLTGAGAIDINETLCIGKLVTVRYRRDDPSVNKLDRGVWQNLEGL
jgi:hypothetical protein